MATRESIIKINLENQDAIRQLGKWEAELIAVRKETTELSKEVRKSDGATAEQEARLGELKSTAKLLGVEIRELSNETGTLTERGLRFRDRMADANLEALKQSGILGQLAARTDFLDRQLEELNASYKAGNMTQAQYNAQQEKLQSELGQTTAKMAGMDAKLDELNKDFKEGRITAEQFRTGVQSVNTEVARASGAFTKGVTDLKQYALGFVGIIAVAQGMSRIISNVIGITADFDKAQSNLGAVMGKTKGEITELTEQAKQLGSVTAFTASQVSEGQTELAKLGFTAAQITQATPGVLALAAATGTDLANAATIAAQTLNAFQLDASETGRIVDVIARSTSLSAFDINSFSAAMSNAAPAAKAVGVSVEEAAAMLSALVDAGIPAEKAGTDLRNIFIKLAKDGRTMDDAFNEVRGSTNQLATAVDMFDQRAAGSAIILAENTEKLGRLKEAYEGAAGSAEQMAKAQLDNLKGDQLLLTSAWEGFVLSVDDGSGVISRGLRLMTQGFTGLLDLLNQINSVSVADSLAAAADAQLKALGGVGNLASDAGKKIVAQYDLIIESIQEYGNTQQDIELIEARRNKIFRDTQALEDAYIKGTLTEKGKAELAVARAAIATIDAEIGKRKAVVESSGVVKIATEVTDKNTEGTERNTAAKGKQAAAIRVLTDELRAFQKAQQDINSGVGIGQMDVVGGIGSQTPIGDPASRLLPGTEIAGNLRDNLAETTELTVDYTNLFMNMSSSIGQALGESFNDVEDANRRIVLSILEMVRNAARMYIAMAMAREVGTKGFIGLGTGIALQVAVEAILAAAINNIKTSGFAEGGMVRQSDGPRYTKNKGDSVLISAAPGEVVMTEEQQRRANRAAGFNIFSAARVPGFAAGGPVGGSVYSFKKGSGMPTAPRPSPAELNATRNAMTMLNTPIYTRITEVNDVQGRVSRIAERGTL